MQQSTGLRREGFFQRLANLPGRHLLEPAERVRPDICIWALEQLIEGIGERGQRGDERA